MGIYLSKYEESLRDGRFSDAEIQCKGYLRAHAEADCDQMTLINVLHCLAQALEGQGKLGEAFSTRLKVRQILTDREASHQPEREREALLVY